MIRVHVKPLSANKAWCGRRFKSKDYISYEQEVLLRLPKFKLPPSPFTIKLIFGFSNKAADWDNPIKLFVDLLQKKYKFNDKLIKRGIVDKVLVKKGKEFVDWELTTWQE